MSTLPGENAVIFVTVIPRRPCHLTGAICRGRILSFITLYLDSNPSLAQRRTQIKIHEAQITEVTGLPCSQASPFETAVPHPESSRQRARGEEREVAALSLPRQVVLRTPYHVVGAHAVPYRLMA